MAVPKIVGIETEYGVALRGAPDPNPVVASSLLINGYVEQHRIGWDFEDESPGRDARGFARDGSQPPEVETHLVNAVLTNGARYYVDHAHPEYSTPECADPLRGRAVRQGGGADPRPLDGRGPPAAAGGPGDRRLQEQQRRQGQLVRLPRELPRRPHRAVRDARAQPHPVVRHAPGVHRRGQGRLRERRRRVDFQISQRADFFEEEVGLETTLKRPIVNTRDEPHADPQKYRRLHVIVGDANLCEVATFLKVGATAIVLAMIEDGFIDKDLSISAPVAAMRTVSHDPTLQATVDCASLGRCTAIELQWEFLRLAAQVRRRDRPRVRAAATRSARWCSTGGSRCSARSSATRRQLDGQLDWVTKLELLRAYVDRDDLSWNDPKLALLDLQYHDVRPARSLYEKLVRGGQDRTPGRRGPKCAAAMVDPPETTRAYFRGTCLARWADSVVAANWDSLVLDVGIDPLRRIPMMEPTRGSKVHVAELFTEVSTPRQLVERLTSS